MEDPLKNMIDPFKNHPSITAIKKKVISDSFDFSPLTKDKVLTKIF